MPHSKTIERAISVTFSRSFAAPVVTRPKTTSSAARPESAITIRSISSSFVVGEDATLFLGQHLLLLEARDDALEGGVEVHLRQRLVAAATGEDRGFVADVRELGAGEAARLPRDLTEVDVRSERLAARVYGENRGAAGEVGRRHEQLAVEAAGTEERGVEILDAVRRAHHDDLLRAFEAVQLDEQLVERLILLAIETAAGALRADGVELIDEDDRGRVLARLAEELAD